MGYFRTAEDIINEACIQLGIISVALTTPVESSNKAVLQVVNLFNAEGRRLSRKYDWSTLTLEHTFPTVNGTYAYDLPTGAFGIYSQRLINGTAWDRTQNLPLTGPLSPQQWQALQGNDVSSLTNTAFRMVSGQIWLYPTPTSVRTIAMEFVSNYWALQTGNDIGDGPDSDEYNEDMDGMTPLIDADLMVAAIKLRYRQDRGYPHQSELDAYETALAEAQGNDGAQPRVSVTNAAGSGPQWNPPGDDGSWGV